LLLRPQLTRISCSLFIYLILSGLTALVARSLYSSFFTPPRASKVTVQRVRTPKSTTPSLTVTESTYDEDWIPKEVLKAVKGKGVKAGKGKGKKGDTSATSGEDSEGSKKRK
jgi:Na+/H+-dicarboxylate symporter